MRRPWLPVLLLLAALPPTSACRGEAATPARVREPAVAGQFFPGAAEPLRAAVQRYLEDAPPPASVRPVAIVAPHAGFVFSGEVAAVAWRRAAARPPDLVVILATNHTAPGLRGVALSPATGFRTPLGVVPVDAAAGDALRRLDPEVVLDGGPHEREHSLEVQLPFMQVLFPGAKLLPLVVGTDDPGLCERLGLALGKLLRDRNALVVASSDLSHYPPAREAAAVDARVLDAIASLDPVRFRATLMAEDARGTPGLSTCACGDGPILAAMAAARALGATRGAVLRYANSGDAPFGQTDRVVGYGAVAFGTGPGAAAPPGTGAGAGAGTGEPSLDAPAKAALLAHARGTIARWLESGTVPSAQGLPPVASLPRGAFVTLKKQGDLRGCIGHMVGDAPLGITVGRMAIAAAVHDPRFAPVTRDELPALEIEISVLTPMRPVGVPREVVVGRDGVLLSKAGRSAVFLPQVATEQGWGRDAMLDHLCAKAGLPAGCWREGASLQTFQAEVFGETHRP